MRSKSMPEAYHSDLDPQERALHYGDGLFETLLRYEGKIPRWQAHYMRLGRGCERLSIALPEEAWLRQRVEQQAGKAANAVIKIIVSRGRGGRGLHLPEDARPSVLVFSYPWTPVQTDGLRVALCQTPLPINPTLAGLKHLNRLDYVLAALELQNRTGIDEGIVCDSEGYLVEGLISNLFFMTRGRVYTPSLEFAGVAGIMRLEVLEQLRRNGIEIEIGRFPAELLLGASECFLCNSVRGVLPIAAIDGQTFDVGETTRSLMRTLNIPAINL